MQIADILTPGRVECGPEAGSKKRTLECISEIIARDEQSVSARAAFDCLVARERLGSTGLGHGVAIPHGRVAGLPRAIGVFLKLNEGVDFDAPDGDPVDLVFGLLVPEDSTEEHLQVLSQLAEMFSDEELRDKLRGTRTADQVFELVSRVVAPH